MIKHLLELYKDRQQPEDIIVSTQPAEIIEFEGQPQFDDIPDTVLKGVTNTDNTVIQDTQNNEFYALFSGRWFQSDSIDGGWKLISSKELPADFKNIPEDSEFKAVLTHIPGTPQAQESRIVAQIPKKAKVNRNSATLTVTYDGDPDFQKIEGTNLTYAVNTDFAVISDGSKYYCCFNGVWFVGDNNTGPWQVADAIPDEIYSIPADNPLYYVTFVKIYSSDDDEVITGYTSGYLNEYIDDSGTVVYGTGYYYRPYYRRGVYYYRRPTWGVAVAYHPYCGGYVYRTTRIHPRCHRRIKKDISRPGVCTEQVIKPTALTKDGVKKLWPAVIIGFIQRKLKPKINLLSVLKPVTVTRELFTKKRAVLRNSQVMFM